MSLPVALAQYTQLPDWVIFAIKSGVKSRLAPVAPVAVPAIPSASVASSTFQATVVLAFAVTVPTSLSAQAQAI